MTYNGTGLAGVTLSGCASQTTTVSGGSYEIYPVMVGTNCTLTPSLAGYTFSPASIPFNDIFTWETGNFTATLNSGSYTISGTVSSGLAGVAMSGCGSGATTGSGGAYSITVGYGTSCTLTPSYVGYTFSPSSKSFTNITSNQTGVNFTATLITFTITGTVTYNGSGMSGVTLSGCGSGATTGSNGAYSTTVGYGTSCTLTPSYPGYTFSPSSKALSYITSNQTGVNFTATANSYAISGAVTAGGAGLSGVALGGCGSGGTSASNGTYSIPVSYGTSCTLTPSLSGFTFSPSSKAFTNITSSQTGINFTANATATATLTVSGPQSGSTYYAGDSFTLTVNGPPNQPVEIYETKNGTVVANGQIGTTNASGVWTASGSWQFTDVASYSETWSVANIPASALNFTVSQFTIGGAVTYNSSGLSGVTMSGCGSGSVATGSNGSYSIPVLASSTCTLTPSLAGYTFSPSPPTFSSIGSNITQNFTATAVSLTISGTVTYGGNGLAGVTMSGSCPSQPMTGSNGSYSITVTYGTSCTLAPSMSGNYTFSPASKTFNNITTSVQQSFTAAPVTSIASLSPTSGLVGTPVTISGNFGPVQGTVTFNGTFATIGTWASNSIGVTVPSGATTGLVVVTAGGVASNGVMFTVTAPAPSISSLSPTSGPVGQSVTVAGSNFGSTQGTSTATFNGVAATVGSWTATSIGVTVPSGATTGPVVVTAGGNPSNGVTFTITPYIASLSPTSGPVGQSVTITGTTFGASGTVAFNGVAATIGSWTATSIGVTVPSTATTGPVVVTAGGNPSNGVTFTITPYITSLSPTSGPAGTSVTITGTTFGASGTVTFNGTAATIGSWTATSIGGQFPRLRRRVRWWSPLAA